MAAPTTFGADSEHIDDVDSAVQVVVPAYGPGPHLTRVLEALLNQNPPIPRIVVSHSGPKPPVLAIRDPRIVVLHCEQRLFAGAARNRGLKVTTSEWVAFVDEDVIVDVGWHVAVLTAISTAFPSCIVGPLGYAESGGYWGMAGWFVEFSSVHPYVAQPPPSGASANMVVHRASFQAMGGFPENWRMGQDTIAQVILRGDGGRIHFERRAVARHINLPGFRRMLRHLYHQGRFSAKICRLHPEGTLAGFVVRWSPLSLCLWLVRLGQIYVRVLSARNGPLVSLVFHTPGILIGLLAWNSGFVSEAFRLGNRDSEY